MKLEQFFAKSELIPVIIQNVKTKQILMLGYTNLEAMQKTIETKTAWFYSRSRQKLWQKGETSGNTLELIEIRYDCDEDSLLYFCIPAGPTCHTGEISCFHRVLEVEA